MGDNVKPRQAPGAPATLSGQAVQALAEVPWSQKPQYAWNLVYAIAFERRGFRIHDEGDVVETAARIMQAYVRPSVRGTDVQLLGLYDDIADAVRMFRLRTQAAKARRGASFAPAVRPVVVADPIEHARGEYIHESTDLVVRGAGIDFAFHRTYRHQTVYDGPLGHRWDHGYNLFLSLNVQRALLWTGTGRQELYLRHPRWGQSGFHYYVPPDGVDATLEPLGNPDAPAGWVRRAPDGVGHVFEPDPDGLGFRLARIEDRWGNQLRFAYIDGRLDRCYVNHDERWVRFHHDDEARIVRVADFTGRAWRYGYDAHGDLIYVTSPATPSRSRGCTTEYRYSTAEHPGGPLAHNLTDVFDPEGRHYLQNRYGSSPAQEDFNRVVYQRLGHGDFWLRYEAVDPDGDGDLPARDRPATRCWVKQRGGSQTLHVYNASGNLLRKEEPHMEGGGAAGARVVWRHRYNRDGQVIASRSPEGSVTHVLTGRDHFYRVHGIDPDQPGVEDELWQHAALTADARRGFARVLATVQRARQHTATSFDWADRWGDVYQVDDADLITKHVYEPVFGQLLSTSDPRATTSPDPRAIEPSEHHRLLTHFEYAGPPDAATRDLVRVIAPTPTLPDGTAGAPVITEIVERDERGRVRRGRDARGTETVIEYFVDGAPDHAGPRTGFVKRMIVDPGAAQDGHLNLTTEYEVDELGRAVAITHPRGVVSRDGRFVTRTSYDALDRVTSERGPTPLDFETRIRYEPAGKPARVERDWRDPGGALRGVMVRRYQYNEDHALVKETWGGEAVGSHFRIARGYDASGTLRFVLDANDTSIHFRHDARDMLVKTIRSYGTAAESTSILTRDGDGRIVAARSGEGRVERYELDSFGRIVAVTDPLGHVVRTSFDRGGRPAVVRRFERRDDGTWWLLSRTETEHDELGRPRRTVANLFDEPVPVSDVASDHEAAPGPGHRVEWQTFHDAMGRVVAVVDPLGGRATTEYDSNGRAIRSIDAAGDRVETAYDEHGNSIRRHRIEIVRDTSGNEIGREVLIWTGTFDERDRLTAESDGLGNTAHRAYDSLDRLVRSVDPLGNVREIEHDIYGRVVAATELRTADGLGGGAPLPPATVRFERDPSGNLLAHIDALGRRTEYRHDRSNRVVEQIFPDGAGVAMRYDRDDLVTAVRDAHGVVIRTEYDAAGRPIRTIVDDAEIDAGVAIDGARLVERRHDALGRLTFAGNAAASIAVRFDSLGHAWREDTVLHAAGGLGVTVERRFDDAGRLVGLTYPGGRRLRHDRDAGGRLGAIVHELDGVGDPGAALSTPRLIARFARAGARLRRVERPSGAATTLRYDGAGRPVEIDHAGSSGTLLRTQQLHDAARNPRLRLQAGAAEPGTDPGLAIVERFGYDAQYQLTARASGPPAAFVDLAPFAPPAVPPAFSDPVPHRQSLVDAAIDDMPPPGPPAETWSYDLTGNRSADSIGGAPRAYAANNRDQYAAVASGARTYDRAGNLQVAGGVEHRHDAWRRLCRVIDRTSGQDVVSYAYDPMGRRIVEHDAGGALVIVYDGPDRIADFRGAVCVAHYVHGDGPDDPVHLATAGIDAWFHTDLQGSVRALSDAAGAPIGHYRFDPFGNLTDHGGAPLGAPGLEPGIAAQPFGFAARPFDPAIGLYDLRARSYDPDIGRFLQRDPAGPIDGTNLYVYAGNHPLGFRDPTGLSRWEMDPNGWAGAQVQEDLVAESSWLGEAVSEVGRIARGIGNKVTDPRSYLEQIDPISNINHMFFMPFEFWEGIYDSAVDVKDAIGHQDPRATTRLVIGALVMAATERGPSAIIERIEERAWWRRAAAVGIHPEMPRLPNGTRLPKGVPRHPASLGRRLTRFFYDPRPFDYQISRAEHWKRNVKPPGASVDHWLLPQKAKRIPQGLRNAGFNLMETPGVPERFKQRYMHGHDYNQWKGMVRSYSRGEWLAANAAENLQRIGVLMAGDTKLRWAFGIDSGDDNGDDE